MRDRTAPQPTCVAVTLLTLALAVALAPVGASTTDATTAAAPTEAVGSTATTPPNASLVARYPAENDSMVERTVVSPADVARVSEPVNDSRVGAWTVTLTLTADGATSFTDALVDSEFVDNPNTCPPTNARNDDGYCLLLVVDGEATTSFGLSQGLANDVRSGAFADDPRLRVLAENHSEARAVWRGFLSANDSTPTANGATATDADRSTDDDGTASESSSATPGFAALGAIAALLGAVALVARRHR